MSGLHAEEFNEKRRRDRERVRPEQVRDMLRKLAVALGHDPDRTEDAVTEFAPDAEAV